MYRPTWQVCRKGTSYFYQWISYCIDTKKSDPWTLVVNDGIYFWNERRSFNGSVSDKRNVQRELNCRYIICANVHIPFRLALFSKTHMTQFVRVQMWVVLSVNSFLWGDFPSASVGLRFVQKKKKNPANSNVILLCVIKFFQWCRCASHFLKQSSNGSNHQLVIWICWFSGQACRWCLILYLCVNGFMSM